MNSGTNERQTEDRIETVLAALRQAEPAPGMEQRISAALLRQANAASPATPRRTWLLIPQLAGLAVVVAAVALLVSAHFYRWTALAPATGHAALQGPTETRAEKAAGFSPLNPVPPREGLQPRTTLTGAEAPAQTQRVPGVKAAAFSANATAATTGRRGLWTRETTQRVLQSQADQSFPAPPLPLTEQERLLVRLVHRDDPVQLAQLTPAAREADLQRDREQVREFFKPPPMLAANFTLEPYPITGGTQ